VLIGGEGWGAAHGVMPRPRSMVSAVLGMGIHSVLGVTEIE
jgi:hypothetical protein